MSTKSFIVYMYKPGSTTKYIIGIFNTENEAVLYQYKFVGEFFHISPTGSIDNNNAKTWIIVYNHGETLECP
jgi:hypothetical protein